MHSVSTSEHFADLSGQRVLVVEDEALVAMLIEEGLLEAGAEVVGTATTVEHAMAMIESAMLNGGLSSVVLDLNLGGKLAYAVADKLASLSVPFVIATGYDKNCDIGSHTGAPLIHKPFSSSMLTSAVAGVA
jgi:DNA-binding response OmpR family regulator